MYVFDLYRYVWRRTCMYVCLIIYICVEKELHVHF